MVDQLLRYLLTIFSFSVFVGCQAIPIDPPVISETLINELEEMNRKYNSPPLNSSDVIKIIGSLTKKDYKFTCKDCDLEFDSWFSSSKEFDKLKKINLII